MKKSLILLGIVCSFAATAAVFAAGATPPLTAPMPFKTATDVIDNGLCVALNWLFYGAIVFSIIYALLSAFGYVTSGGDMEKTKGAKNRLLYAAIGVAVALVAKGVPFVVASFLPNATIEDICSSSNVV